MVKRAADVGRPVWLSVTGDSGGEDAAEVGVGPGFPVEGVDFMLEVAEATGGVGVLIEPGGSVAGFTLRVYAHLFPSSEERARAVLDRVFGGIFDVPATVDRAP